jgi:cytochrome c556
MSRGLVALSAAAGLLALASLAAAQEDAVARRQAIFKSFDEASEQADAMMGAGPFDLAKAQGILRTFERGADELKGLFPAPSAAPGRKTAALPAIWERPADFQGRLAKFQEDVTAALGSAKDAASFKRAMDPVFADCTACHRSFRARRR